MAAAFRPRVLGIHWFYFIAVLLVMLPLAFAGPAECTCPPVAGKRVTWIVPNKAGGGNDRYSRLLKPFVEKTLGVEIHIQNIQGAGGIVGCRKITSAPADGRTLGFINAAGMLAAYLAGEENAPDPTTDFTILGRVARSRQVWATASGSTFKSMEDVLRHARKRPIVFGTRDVGNQGFINASLVSHLIGLDIEIVTGYLGSSAGVMAAMRGEVDLVAYNFESILRHIESGDMRPLLQISTSRISPHAALDTVPVLGGETGVAVRQSRTDGNAAAAVRADASAIVHLLGAGRLVVAPPGMSPELATCLQNHLAAIFRDPEFQNSAKEARLSLDTSGGAGARQDLVGVSQKIDQFIPLIRASIGRVRE